MQGRLQILVVVTGFPWPSVLEGWGWRVGWGGTGRGGPGCFGGERAGMAEL